MTARPEELRLVADIGGTHVRFGLAGPGGVDRIETFYCADYESLPAAARAYLGSAAGPAPRGAAFAVAGPIEGDEIRLTNRAWRFSIEEVRRELDLERLEVINDFAGLALSVPALTPEDLRPIKPGVRRPASPIAVVGPGTGLGVAALVPAGDTWATLTTEGGHRDLAAHSDREWEVVRALRERFGHVSVERVLSGSGLVNLYETLTRLEGGEPETLIPREVEVRARDGSSPACVEALRLFSGWLGAVAGDLVLTQGARGGVYLGGGMLAKLDDVFDQALFRERFLAKGRFRDYLSEVPVDAIVHPYATLLGVARAGRDASVKVSA